MCSKFPLRTDMLGWWRALTPRIPFMLSAEVDGSKRSPYTSRTTTTTAAWVHCLTLCRTASWWTPSTALIESIESLRTTSKAISRLPKGIKARSIHRSISKERTKIQTLSEWDRHQQRTTWDSWDGRIASSTSQEISLGSMSLRSMKVTTTVQFALMRGANRIWERSSKRDCKARRSRRTVKDQQRLADEECNRVKQSAATQTSYQKEQHQTTFQETIYLQSTLQQRSRCSRHQLVLEVAIGRWRCSHGARTRRMRFFITTSSSCSRRWIPRREEARRNMQSQQLKFFWKQGRLIQMHRFRADIGEEVTEWSRGTSSELVNIKTSVLSDKMCKFDILW